jgi:hypothetical protein
MANRHVGKYMKCMFISNLSSDLLTIPLIVQKPYLQDVQI